MNIGDPGKTFKGFLHFQAGPSGISTHAMILAFKDSFTSIAVAHVSGPRAQYGAASQPYPPCPPCVPESPWFTICEIAFKGRVLRA